MHERFESVDFLTEASILDDPVPYYDWLREKPVRRVPPGIVAVTGWDEVVEVWRATDRYSACNSSAAPYPLMEVASDVDDISDLIEERRSLYAFSEHITTFDPPRHTAHRGLLMRLMTPKRIAEIEGFQWELADRLIDSWHERGRIEFISEYAYPYALLSVANLLGVPEEDHDLFLGKLRAYQAGAIGQRQQGNPFAFMDDVFRGYVEDRRRDPRPDVITGMATATFPDGTLPEVMEVVRIAVFLFAAGQGTTAHLMGMALRHLAEQPDVQTQLRDTPELIPTYIEEILRTQSPTKSLFRLATRTHDLGGERIHAGDAVMVMPGAANRDPRRCEDPGEVRLDRANPREHVAFGRGIHACPGASLARAEVRVSLTQLLRRLGDITISAEHHGPPGERRFSYLSSFLLRGLKELHVECTPT